MELNETSEEEHLGLAPAGDGVPGLEALGGDGGEVNAGGKLSGKAEAGTDGPPSHEGGHGDAAVLDLGVAEPCDGLVGSEVGEAEGVPLLAELNGVGLGEDGLARHAGVSGSGGGRGWRGFLGLLSGGLLLGHEGGSGNTGDIGRHEGRGGASKSGKGQERQLHFGYIFPIAGRCVLMIERQRQGDTQKKQKAKQERGEKQIDVAGSRKDLFNSLAYWRDVFLGPPL